MNKIIDLVNSLLKNIDFKKKCIKLLNYEKTDFEDLLLILFTIDNQDISIIKDKLKNCSIYDMLKQDFEKKLNTFRFYLNYIENYYDNISIIRFCWQYHYGKIRKKILKKSMPKVFLKYYGVKADPEELFALFDMYNEYEYNFCYNLIAVLNYYLYIDKVLKGENVENLEIFFENNQTSKEDCELAKIKIKKIEDYIKQVKDEKKAKKTILLLKNLKLYLTNHQSDSFLELSKEYIDKLPMEMLEPICKSINEYNYELYKRLKDENKKSELPKLFLKYGVSNNFYEEELQLLNNIEIEKVENILKTFSASTFKFSFSNQDWTHLLHKSNITNIETILNALHLKYVDLDYISSNLYIFWDPYYSKFKNNLDVLIKNNIGCKSLNDLMLVDNLEDYINLALKYELDINDENVFKNMMIPHFFDYIDLFIEQGFYDILKNDPSILNENLEVFIKRLIIAKSIKMPLANEDGKVSNSIKNGFFIPDKLLDNYIVNVTPLKIDSQVLDETSSLLYDETDNLEEFKVGNLIYNFDGVFISRLKYLRNKEILKDKEYTLECLCHNSILNEQQFESIASMVSRFTLDLK